MCKWCWSCAALCPPPDAIHDLGYNETIQLLEEGGEFLTIANHLIGSIPVLKTPIIAHGPVRPRLALSISFLVYPSPPSPSRFRLSSPETPRVDGAYAIFYVNYRTSLDEVPSEHLGRGLPIPRL